MAEAGVFAPHERVELLEGEIVPVSPQNPPHAHRITKLSKLFVLTFHQTHDIRVQLPLTLSEWSEPEPDLALVPLLAMEACPRHPSTADLIMEISDSTLALDRGEKASLYAKAGIPDYWILNLKDQRLEIRRSPIPSANAPYGFEYGALTLHAPDESVTPLCSETTVFQVSDLLGTSR